jgi:transcriptional regulator with XRE-family HTH domain
MMDEKPCPDVGARIRTLREAEGLSLRALANQCGLSINAISRIERGECSPTVASLHKLATALGLPITDIFEGGREIAMVLVRKNDRPRSRGDGMLIESLGSGLLGQRLEPFLMTLLPGASSGEGAISHGGEEFIFCLEGQVDYQVDDGWFRLEEGDSLLFRADQAHQCKNTGLEKAVVLLILQASDEEIRLSQQLHLMFANE